VHSPVQPATPLPPSPTHSAPPLAPLDQLVPEVLRVGEPLIKVTQNKATQRHFRMDPDSAQIVWESKRGNAIPLYAIRDVRIGTDAQSYRRAMQVSDVHESRWITIIYQTPEAYKAVHLVALTDASLARWRDALVRIQNQCEALASGRIAPASVQSQWLAASWHRDPNMALDLPAVARLCQRTGVQISRPELRALFDAADIERRGALRFDAFQRFVAALKRRSDLEEHFAAHASHGMLPLDAFTAFVREEQGEWAWSDAHIARLYTRYGAAHVDGFTAFLTSRDNAAGAPYWHESERRFVAEDEPLTLPLCAYYVASSHNTYLVGGQWKGDSTVEGYVRALQQGARSVELDCWDGPNGQPDVTHGRTLTSRVSFDNVVAAIAQYAFVSSPYPLILSLEVHNDVPQQETMAAILRARLGTTLVSAPLPNVPPGTLPSPEQLRHRVLVKVSTPTMRLTQFKIRRIGRVAESMPSLAGERGGDSSELTERESDSRRSASSSDVRSSETSSRGASSAAGAAAAAARSMRRVAPRDERLLAPSLAALLVYTVGVKCRGINKKEHYASEHMFSLSDSKARRMIRQDCTGFIKHNLTHLTRVYPSLTLLSRLGSSSANFDPLDMWASGCQLVALNWQTSDYGMERNKALFHRSQGYVRKPDALRVRRVAKNALSGSLAVRIDLTVVSAQQLPNPAGDVAASPFVALSVDVPSQWARPVRIEGPLLGGSCANYRAAGSPAASGCGRGSPLVATPSTGPAPPPDDSATPPSPTGRSTSRGPRTATVPGNGLAPIWNARFAVHVLLPAGVDTAALLAHRVHDGMPRRAHDARVLAEATRGLLDLCFVRLQVLDEQTSGPALLARTMISTGRLGRGLRHLPLYDAQLGALLYSTICVHTEYTLVGLVE